MSVDIVQSAILNVSDTYLLMVSSMVHNLLAVNFLLLSLRHGLNSITLWSSKTAVTLAPELML